MGTRFVKIHYSFHIKALIMHRIVKIDLLPGIPQHTYLVSTFQI